MIMATTEYRSQGRVRRLSSVEATRADLVGGPSVVVPPKHLMASSNAYELARSMEIAKNHLNEDVSSSEVTPRSTSPSGKPVITTDRYAYAFDIDGVLVRGGKPIPAAVEALKVLNGENEYGIKVYVLPQKKLNTFFRTRHGTNMIF